MAMRGGFRLACVVFAGLSLGAGLPAAQARDFRAADNQVEGYPTVQALHHLSRLLAERTGDRLTIKVFSASQLGEEKDTIEQTMAGAIDINRTNVAPLTALAPKLSVLVLPFLFRSGEHLRKVLDGPIGEELLRSLEPKGLVGLAFYDSGARSIYNSVRPVRTVADLKGLRIRVQQSETAIAMIRALGAEPVPLSYGQVMPALTSGLIDGAENNWPSYVSTNHFTAARYYTLTEHTIGPEILTMSKKAWDGLSAKDQALFREAAAESSAFMHEVWTTWENRARRQAEDAGNTITTLTDRAGFEEATRELRDKALADPVLRELVERIRQVQ
ncbi:C4-dicarboxylate ABC transporter [Alsobacter metallidurans]|uniref:C4-dicarboxylate ABC transporter n=1 Tax=Alsobacter metallidurans TaxID=340221 RepID=A0A917I3R3_9HYPH|nr:TRAP transporter substrate-binding protein [Alsobacter metallidurans]GGH06691.1 C4-dicarboxylate ABC transporter [Alsobacter metallidurans]